MLPAVKRRIAGFFSGSYGRALSLSGVIASACRCHPGPVEGSHLQLSRPRTVARSRLVFVILTLRRAQGKDERLTGERFYEREEGAHGRSRRALRLPGRLVFEIGRPRDV